MIHQRVASDLSRRQRKVVRVPISSHLWRIIVSFVRRRVDGSYIVQKCLPRPIASPKRPVRSWNIGFARPLIFHFRRLRGEIVLAFVAGIDFQGDAGTLCGRGGRRILEGLHPEASMEVASRGISSIRV